MDASIVEYFAEHEGYKCGYCKGQDSNYSHGMWAHVLTTEDYEGLLNRGFRRSGKYLYKPTNHMTCCPSYTINLHALDFQLTNSQKKTIKKVNRYLQTGENPKLREKCDTKQECDKVNEDKDTLDCREEINFKEAIDIDMKISTSEKSELVTSIENDDQIPRKRQMKRTNDQVKNTSTAVYLNNNINTSTPITVRQDQQGQVNSSATDPKKSHQKKAKQIRIERKRAKLIAQGKLQEDQPLIPKKLPSQNQIKTIEALMDEVCDPTKLKKQLVIKLVYTKSPEFESTFKLEHEIYQKYQTIIHNDTEDECSPKQFRRFLCDTPLVKSNSGVELEGSFHQQYWLDSELIAVGVIDILPQVLSSVYFFYNPKFAFLSLGNYGALREIAFTRELHRTQEDIKYYYMGYYIHSCTKMRYKGAYAPSFLLCPETFNWVQLDDDLRQRLDQQKYQRLDKTTSDTTEEQNTRDPRIQNIQKVQIFFRQCVLPYPIYELKRGSADRDQIQQYCNLVGEEVAGSMLLYRS